MGDPIPRKEIQNEALSDGFYNNPERGGEG
jgi:hypothetical protein